MSNKTYKRDYSLEGLFYKQAGSADNLIASISEHEVVPLLIAKGTLAYLRGDIDAAYRFAVEAEKYHTDISDKLSIQMLHGVCAMYRGDIDGWERARKELACISCDKPEEEEFVRMWYGGYDSSIFVHDNFPEWFCKGRFDVLPPATLPFAYVFYAKYQLVKWKNNMLDEAGANRLNEEEISLPQVCEPLITIISRQGAVVAEIRLRLICATGYRLAGNDKDAAYHIDRAIGLAIPDRIYAPLAEYMGHLDLFFVDKLREVDVKAMEQVKDISLKLADGWIKLHNYATERSVSGRLSMRESEVARLAAYGLSNDEIAKRLHVSVNTVRTHLQSVYGKTGANGREALKNYII